ncbi:MAG TPA: hypothetical protein DCS55_13245, partial [Acidimicrobiaceae bacterium]|nr:hypothetical protein [Acidimicrobiaceae bacterium]
GSGTDESTDSETGEELAAAGAEDSCEDEGDAGDGDGAEGTEGEGTEGDDESLEEDEMVADPLEGTDVLMDPDTDTTEYANHGEAVSAYAKEHCRTEAARAVYKNHGECVRKAAQSDLGKASGDSDDAPETETEAEPEP